MRRRKAIEMSFVEPLEKPALRVPQSWRGFTVEYVALTSDAPYAFKSRGESHYVALHDMTLRDGELRIDGLSPLAVHDLRDTITFVPKGCAIEGWSHPDARANNFVAMYFDPEAIREDLGTRYTERDPAPFAYARYAPLAATLRKLEALVRESEIDALYAESLGLLASLEVLGVIADTQGKLSERQISAVTDYVEANLDKPISLDDLAQIAGLSRFHFSRAFKASTGENPHGFVQTRRIARAATMLVIGDLPVETIALAVGYKGAPQFRRVFLEVMGTSPLKYRMAGR